MVTAAYIIFGSFALSFIFGMLLGRFIAAGQRGPHGQED